LPFSALTIQRSKLTWKRTFKPIVERGQILRKPVLSPRMPNFRVGSKSHVGAGRDGARSGIGKRPQTAP
jgi:hypothetical protein